MSPFLHTTLMFMHAANEELFMPLNTSSVPNPGSIKGTYEFTAFTSYIRLTRPQGL